MILKILCVTSGSQTKAMELNINISQNQSVHEKIKKIIGLTNLDALYLTEKEIENIFEFTMLIDS